MKLRIAAASAVGVLLIGILAWPAVEPNGPYAVLSVFGGELTAAEGVILTAIAFLAGLGGCLVSWPYGMEIGPLAVPAGLCIWALRAGSIGKFIQANPTAEQRQAFFSIIQWEGVFWLAVILAGFAGVLAGFMVVSRVKGSQIDWKGWFKRDSVVTAVLALAGSVIIGLICVKLLVQDMRLPDRQLGSVVAQPAMAQIAFGVLVSFGLAGFVAKKFFGAGCIWSVISTAVVTIFSIKSYAKPDVLEYMAQNHPAIFFANSLLAVLPVQMVAFGSLGAIVGYWLAVRYDYWREHEMS